MQYHTLCFSILFDEKKNIISHLGELFFDRSKLNNIKLESFKTSMIDWVNPKYGQLTTFFTGGENNLFYSVFFSNSVDGFSTMSRFLSRKVACKCIQIRISSKPESGIFEYELIEAGETKRIVQLLQDTRWQFYTKGDPLPYEDVSIYENRLMKNKFNVEIIKTYLKAEGIDFDTLFNGEYSGVKYETISWEYLD